MHNSELNNNGFVPLSINPTNNPAPKGWIWKLLTSIARLESGHTPSRYHPEWWNGDIPWIALPDIRALDGKVAHETTEYINQDGIENSSARLLPKGTVVLSRTASIGYVTIMGREMATSQDFFNWVCGPEINAKFLLWLLHSSRKYIRSLSSGSVHKTVYLPTAKSFWICMPPVNVQVEIVSVVESQMAAIEVARTSAEAQLNVINGLRMAFLHRAFSGDI